MLVIFSLMTGASKKAPKIKVQDKVPCICYSVKFRKDKGKNVLALLNSASKVNAMALVYAAHLGLKVRMTDLGVQKIDGSSLAT